MLVNVSPVNLSQSHYLLGLCINEDHLNSSPSSEEFEGGDLDKDNESDIDNIDFANFKGIYIDEDPNRKFQDPDTGCHFEYYDLCKRMAKLK
jgi:hypothetical protein